MSIENKLSQSLKAYYRRQKNRVIFCNGDTLNQLAEKMWEGLEFSQVDAAVLSKVINGKRLFSPRQLEVFSDLLSLKEPERSGLKKALAQEILERLGLDTEILAETELGLEILDFMLREIDQPDKDLKKRGLDFFA